MIYVPAEAVQGTIRAHAAAVLGPAEPFGHSPKFQGLGVMSVLRMFSRRPVKIWEHEQERACPQRGIGAFLINALRAVDWRRRRSSLKKKGEILWGEKSQIVLTNRLLN